MAIDSSTAPPADTRLDDLYWHTDRTIDDIVEELDLSRNSLYASITPIAAGAPCPTCAGMLFFTNRMNRAARVAGCDSCGLETQLDDFDAAERELRAETRMNASPNGAAERAIDRWRQELGEIEPRRAALIAGAAGLGLVVGAAAIRSMRV